MLHLCINVFNNLLKNNINIGSSFVVSTGNVIQILRRHYDELIVSLKEKGYSNDSVCAQLVREGRINYDKKTVGSRYLRLYKCNLGS